MIPRKHADAMYGRGERRAFGVVATITNIETGEIRVEHVGAPLTTVEAVAEVAELCDRLGPDWRVRTLSHPLSILRDLDNGGRQRAAQTEAGLLRRVGRSDLLEHVGRFSRQRRARHEHL